MISELRLAQAFDTMNLPRGASSIEVKERFISLKSRLAPDSARFIAVSEAYDLINEADIQREVQLNVAAAGLRSRSERELDLELNQLQKRQRVDDKLTHSSKQDMNILLTKPVDSAVEKVTKPVSVSGDFWEKLRKAILTSEKYLRSIKLLLSILKEGKLSDELNETIRIALYSPDSSSEDFWAFRSSEERAVIADIIKEAESSDDLELASHRLALFSDDNFVFSNTLKNLQSQLGKSQGIFSHDLACTLRLLSSPDITNSPAKVSAALKVSTEAYRSIDRFSKEDQKIILDLQKFLNKKANDKIFEGSYARFT